MYHHLLMAYFKNESHRGTLAAPDFASRKSNPSCGDEISFTGRLANSIITDLKYEGAGCIISQATASFLCEYAQGKKIPDILALSINGVLDKLELKLGPNRLQCVQLSLESLQDALTSYRAHA
jgi:nitrogen fixation NifU-like protein